MVRSVVLVAAPHAGFRDSIVFLLTSEHIETDAHAGAADAFASAQAPCAVCAVVDDEAVEDWREARVQFERFARPVIFLTGRAGMLPHVPLLTSLAKPFLGKPLVDAVHAAIAGAQRPPT